MGELVAILLSLIVSATGIDRTVDPVLTMDAERRVQEIQTDFSHNGMVYAEVLGYRLNINNPVEDMVFGTSEAFLGWMNSPAHREILLNADFTRIGCAIDWDDHAFFWFACSLAESLPVVEVPVNTPAPVVLPNTAMEKP